MSGTQLTLQDWEKLYNMLQEQRDQIRQLEARIPKTGLFSHSMLTRIVTVCGYVFVAGTVWNIFVALLGVWQAILFPAIAIIFLAIMVITAKKAKQIESDIGMDAHLNTLRN